MTGTGYQIHLKADLILLYINPKAEVKNAVFKLDVTT